MSKTKTIKPNELADLLNDILGEYADDIAEEVAKAVKETGKETKRALKDKAKAAGIGGDKYVKSFKVKNQNRKLRGVTVGASSTVYNSVSGVGHLLERAHPIKNQTGQIYGMSKAYPHWEPAEQEAVEALDEKIKDIAQD